MAELNAILERRKKMMAGSGPRDLPKNKGADSELAAKLARRAEAAEPVTLLPTEAMEKQRAGGAFNPATEFPEFSRKEISEYSNAFRSYDTDRSGTLNIEELKKMMEKLGHPQTHTALLAMLREAGSGGEINQRQFFEIFRKAKKGDSIACEGLQALSASVQCVDVSEVGVGGAKSFFEAKAQELQRSKEMEQEIKAEQAVRKEAVAQEKQRKTDFKDRLNMFNKPGGNPVTPGSGS